MDVLDLLIADHNRMRGLFARYTEANEADRSDEAAALAARIVEELTVHMAAEEEVLYQAVKERNEEIHEDVAEGVEEHHVAKVLIGEIAALPPGNDVWVAKMTVLIESVEHHVDEEEEALFPSVRSASSASWREALGDKLESAKVARGAAALADKMELTNAELRALAREQEIPGRSRMAHDELAATVDGRR